MSSLNDLHCQPVAATSPQLSTKQIHTLLVEIPYWSLIKISGVKHIERIFHFKDFLTAIDFTNQVGNLAECEGHHPAILTEWGKVKITWSTHAIQGLHNNDFIMAAKTDLLFIEYSKE